MVGEHVAREALALDLLEVLGLVFVEHAGGHVLQAALALAGHIKQCADGGVDLPDVVGVVAGQCLHRGRGAQLIRVQRVLAQRAGAGTARELARLARIGAHHAGEQGVVGAKPLQCQLERVDGLVVGAKALHELGGKLLRVGQGQAGGARIAAAFALGLHGDFFQAAHERGARHVQVLAGGGVHSLFAAMAGRVGAALHVQQSINQGGAHGRGWLRWAG